MEGIHKKKNDWLQLGSGIKNPQSEGASKMRAVITIIFRQLSLWVLKRIPIFGCWTFDNLRSTLLYERPIDCTRRRESYRSSLHPIPRIKRPTSSACHEHQRDAVSELYQRPQASLLRAASRHRELPTHAGRSAHESSSLSWLGFWLLMRALLSYSAGIKNNTHNTRRCR